METPEPGAGKVAGRGISRKPFRPLPAGLEDDGRGASFWDVMTTSYEFNPGEMVLLASACQTMDLITRLQDEMEDAPMIVHSPAQGDVVNRLVGAVKEQRTELRNTITALKLPMPESAIGGQRGALSELPRGPKSHRRGGN